MALWAHLWFIASLHWMLLHGPEGGLYWVNMDQVTSLRAPNPADMQRLARGTRCIVLTSDAKIQATVESCEQIYQLIAGMR